MSGQNNRNTVLATIFVVLLFICVVLIVLILRKTIEIDYYENILLVLLFSAVIFSITFVMFFFLQRNHKPENFGNFERIFRNRVKQNRYFSNQAWQKKYREYVRAHPLKSLDSSSITMDLLKRTIKSRIMLVSSIHLSHIGNILSFITQIIILYSLIKNILACISGGTIFSRWLKTHPEYTGKRDEIIHSYLNGYAFECACFCLVIGDEYIHAFDGHYFQTVRKESIVKVIPVIEHVLLNYINYYNEYQFKIKFIYTEAGEEKAFFVTLDQFQVMMIMMQFFPDVQLANPQYISIEQPHGYISVDQDTSPLVLDRPVSNCLNQVWI